MPDAVPTTRLPAGEPVAILGQGRWHMAEDPRRRRDEIAALRRGLELGLNLIDTAEMYADGGAEELVAEAFAGRRDELFLVSKVLPQNASRRGTVAACERSLRRLRIDRIDLYLLHWRGSVPLAETIEAFEVLRAAGKIGAWGVSNLDLSDMQELIDVPQGDAVQTNQVLYNLTRRGIEFDLQPWCRARHIPLMAYSPIEQGRLLGHPALAKIAAAHGVSPAQVALAWLMRQDDVIVIPKSSRVAHIDDNLAALDLTLTDDDLAALDRAFPPPRRATPLDML
jgi:diketogulonate reductase-like aldo/keto reductase